MIRQYRIDRFNGIEWLVCELYFKHTWNQQENEAYARFLDSPGGINQGVSRSEFRTMLDDWLDIEHPSQEDFYGLTESIPAIDRFPHLVIRGAIVDNKVASLNVEFMNSVTSQVVLDSISKFFDFLRSPHWRNTILNSISNYGSLFGSDNDS